MVNGPKCVKGEKIQTNINQVEKQWDIINFRPPTQVHQIACSLVKLPLSQAKNKWVRLCVSKGDTLDILACEFPLK